MVVTNRRERKVTGIATCWGVTEIDPPRLFDFGVPMTQKSRLQTPRPGLKVLAISQQQSSKRLSNALGECQRKL